MLRPVLYLATTLRNERTLKLFMSQALELGLELADVSESARTGTFQFHHVPALKRSSILMHRITLPDTPANSAATL